MPVLTPNTPFASATPQVSVENRLAAGTWLFRLVVVDTSGNQSAPAELKVSVRAPVVPGPTISGPLGHATIIGVPHVTIPGPIG